MFVCTYMGHLFYFHLMEACLFPNFENFLYVPIWALLILDAHSFSGSNPILDRTLKKFFSNESNIEMQNM